MAKDGPHSLYPRLLALTVSLAAMAGLPPAAFSDEGRDASARTVSALTRSPSGLRAVERLEPEALRRWPESFGGLWLEGGKVFVAFTDSAERRIGRLGRAFPEPELLRAVTVDDSLAALRRLQAQMIADRESNPPTRDPSRGGARSARTPRPPEPPPEPRRDYDLEIDIKRNLVVAIVEEPVTPELTAVFVQRYGEDVLVEQGLLARPDACTARTNCKPFLRAGLKTNAPRSACTTAFNVEFSPFQTAYLALSAAHCGNPTPTLEDPYLAAEGPDVGADRYHAGLLYGQVVQEQLADRVDAELHSVGNGFDASPPFIFVTDATKDGYVYKVGTYDGLPVGLDVCKAGQKSGQSCGTVLSKTYSPFYVPGGIDFIRTSACAEPGDSGGPLFHKVRRSREDKRYEAIGVQSGSAAPNCGDPDDFSTFGHVEFVIDAFSTPILAVPY